MAGSPAAQLDEAVLVGFAVYSWLPTKSVTPGRPIDDGLGTSNFVKQLPQKTKYFKMTNSSPPPP